VEYESMTRVPALPIACLALAASSGSPWLAPARADEGGVREVAVAEPAAREVEPDGGARPDDFQFGAVLGVGFPRPLAVEGMFKVQRLVSLGAEYSLLPSMTISDVGTAFWAVAATMRVFPFRNGFFIGLRAGQQHLSAATTLIAGDQRFPITASVRTVFLNPRAGVLWTFSSGVTLGIDAGLQIPVSSRASGVLAANEALAIPEAMAIVGQVGDVADYLGETTIPTLDLLRVGLLL
jgi:hypothetical protein